ncbi:carcinoembryonic antigen-related cell adhesion molecule 1-like [Dendropsophus ebraccatus]|uniref:carcinoembryonic antigen-related cell adhesion molecule 1-like n=1 Tax=Dendropsophus ebraccatus TaxID=150705 RepID=UPI003831C04C
MKGFVITVLLGLTVDVTSGAISIQLIPQYPVINGSVTLSVTGVSEEIEYAIWYKGHNQATQYQFLSYFPGSSSSRLVPGPLYNPRITAFNNGSLEIKDLNIKDEGNYIVKIQSTKQEDISVTLTVYEPVTKPKIKAPITQPKENDSFTLTCDTLHTVKIRWSRRGTGISSETELSADNKTLTFPSIKRGDTGQYQCEAQNLVSKDSSDPYTLTVTYGPDDAQIEGLLSVRSGSPVVLTCSADSSPPPIYQWKANDTVSKENTNNYNISNAKTEDKGVYTCMVRNPVTLRTATASVYVNVTAELVIDENQLSLEFILGLAFAIIIGAVVIIIGSVCAYRKCVTKRVNGCPSNIQYISGNSRR